MSAQTLRLLSRELAQLTRNPPEGVRVRFDEDDLLGSVEGLVEGPAGTPYAGGYFKVRFNFVDVDFPNMPPKCTMITKIFHPNISKTGEICVDTLKKSWRREYGIGHVLVTIKCLFIVPNPESALDEEAGKLLLEEYDSYFKMAKLMTGIHATPKKPPPEFVNIASNTAATTATTASAAKPVKQTPISAASIPQSPSSKASPTPSNSTGSTFSPARPTLPLQNHLQQSQIPPAQLAAVADGKGLGIGGIPTGPETRSAKLASTGAGQKVSTAGGKVVKPAAAGTAGVTAANKAKRGLKRL